MADSTIQEANPSPTHSFMVTKHLISVKIMKADLISTAVSGRGKLTVAGSVNAAVMASVLDVGDGDSTDGGEAGEKVVTGADVEDGGVVDDGARVDVGGADVAGVDLICIAIMTLSTHGRPF